LGIRVREGVGRDLEIKKLEGDDPEMLYGHARGCLRLEEAQMQKEEESERSRRRGWEKMTLGSYFLLRGSFE